MNRLEIIKEPPQPWLRKQWHKITKFFKSTLGTVIITALVTSFINYQFQVIGENSNFENNKKKVETIVNAEVFEQLAKADKYVQARNEIAFDAYFASFLLDTRFNTEPLADLLATNFQYLDEPDVYYLAILRDRLVSFNHRLDLVAKRMDKPRVSDPSLSCRFAFFPPEEKKLAHQLLNDDFNRIINSIKHLSFFSGNPFPDLNAYFELTDTQIGLYYFSYNPEYSQIPSCLE